jgi:exosortase
MSSPATLTAGSASSTRSTSLWKISVITTLIVVLYAEVLSSLASDWWQEENLSYGMLVPPMSLYIAWLRRRVTLELPVIPDNRGLLVTGAACLVYVLGKFGAEFFLPRISFVILLAGLVWTFWGIARLRSLAFPFFLLATMVPLPVIVYNAVAAPLQLLASQVATNIAQAVGVSVYRDGNVIQLANLSLGVEEACSGLNSLSSLIVGSILLGFLKLTRPGTRLVLFVLTVPLAIAVNVVRVAGTAIIADYKPEFAQGFYHAFSGWLVFVVGFGVQYLLTLSLARWFEPRRSS